ncbi:galactose-1-phosphate uridylyltransferase [Streptomyces prasinopilosus]|uniref:Galactose-1-phosphate uridylyltransferase n=1 Tax=Streptomyces prasinopilosus TaxID=67344 RepID=A0A1G6M315_9ACTN|nr:galactose-1-phosphate uridylyltransferase [Streptomyces prasinopilosus]SDC49747.1 UDPglucose--hexose-1-phosphate uridylyltransferase [Streptomyces prasinopilosus]
MRLYADDRSAPARHEMTEPAGRVDLDSGSRLRWDALAGEWVVMAAHRLKRPFSGVTSVCPLCPGTGAECEIPGGAYDVAVFDNRYPALGAPGPRGAPPAAPEPFTDVPAAGVCEVVSFGSAHNTTLAEQPVRRVRTVIEAWADRTRALNSRPDVAQVVCFENHGAAVGASLAHPHGQIYGYPFVPPLLARGRDAARRARRAGGCLFCDTVAAEEVAAVRVVLAGRHWIAMVPYAARWPFEVHLFARRHVPDLPALDEEERAELALVYRSVLRRFAAVAETPLPYMALWAQAPARGGREADHLHARLFSTHGVDGRVKRLAAGELGTGAWVSEADPEAAAAALRAAIPSDRADVRRTAKHDR